MKAGRRTEGGGEIMKDQGEGCRNGCAATAGLSKLDGGRRAAFSLLERKSRVFSSVRADTLKSALCFLRRPAQSS